MLLLTRRQNESIIIGDDICITILETRGGQTKVGIEAPRQISVHRKEIWDRIQLEKVKS